MKIRYKKAMLLTLLGTLGIGIMTFSLTPDKREEKKNNNVNASPEEVSLAKVKTVSPSPMVTQETSPSSVSIPTNSPTNTPTSAPLPVYPLETDGYSKINALIKAYYLAKINCDIDQLKNFFNDPSAVPTREQLQQDTLYYEDYQSIKCYVKKSFEDGSYIVYAYYELKFLNIDTPAPSVDRFYITTNKLDEPQIFYGTLDDKTSEYYLARNNDADVQALIKATNDKGEKAKKKDELLKAFWDGLTKSQDTTNQLSTKQ